MFQCAVDDGVVSVCSGFSFVVVDGCVLEYDVSGSHEDGVVVEEIVYFGCIYFHSSLVYVCVSFEVDASERAEYVYPSVGSSPHVGEYSFGEEVEET